MRALRDAPRRQRGWGALRRVCASGRAQGVIHRAARCGRDHAVARGVSRSHAAVRPAGLAGHGASGRRRGRGDLVPFDLPDREEDRARMAEMRWSVAGQTSHVRRCTSHVRRCTSHVRRWASPAVAAVLALAGPLAGQTSLSIYSDGRVVLRRTLPQALEKGRNRLTLKLDGLDPATLFSPDTSVALVSAVLRPPTDRGAALESALGQTLSFVRTKGDTVRATVLRVAPPQYRLSDGRLLLSEPGEPLFPAELVRTAPEDVVVLEAARARPRTELAYATEGARWEAVYQVVLGGAERAAVSGAATIVSQSLRADSTDVQIVAGSINRAPRTPQPKFDYVARGVAAMEVREEAAVTSEQAVGDAHVYQLPGRVSFAPAMPVTTALFPRATVAYTQEFVVPGVLPLRGFFGPMPTEPNRVPVLVWYNLNPSRGTEFGDRPLPGGTVQLYQADSG